MEGEIVAVGGFERERRVDRVGELENVAFFVIIFVAIGLVGRDVPSGGVDVDIEFGELVGDADAAEFGLRGDFVTESDGVVENAKTHGDDAIGFGVFGEVEGGFVIVVGEVAVFAPHELDGFVFVAVLSAHKAEVLAEWLLAADVKAEFGETDEWFAVTLYAIKHFAVCEDEKSLVATIRRGDGLFNVIATAPFCPPEHIYLL